MEVWTEKRETQKMLDKRERDLGTVEKRETYILVSSR